MLRMDVFCFGNEAKNLHFQKYPDTCGERLRKQRIYPDSLEKHIKSIKKELKAKTRVTICSKRPRACQSKTKNRILFTAVKRALPL